jgi:hypothetical protein
MRRESAAHLLLTRAVATRLLTAHKPHASQLVVWWVTTCESWLLYVFISIRELDRILGSF